MTSIPHVIFEELRRRAEEKGLSLDEFLAEVSTQGLDPTERAGKYIDAALELIAQAKEELRKDDLRQASEKIWGACALAIKAYAFWRDGEFITSHGELWRYKNKVIEELGEWVRDVWMYANAMHVNFYEGVADRSDVEKALELVSKLVEAVRGKVRR
ncbi:MAG: hypothetical protein DRN15_09635 [Thermoprotei archaeon]|nr:MAG: hypothetical protein DRN15_09635 [Thermoprotei archaeon]RLF23919.1 MAG: hypothetical protein DRM97_04220 [Thermoprotei archaeon]